MSTFGLGKKKMQPDQPEALIFMKFGARLLFLIFYRSLKKGE